MALRAGFNLVCPFAGRVFLRFEFNFWFTRTIDVGSDRLFRFEYRNEERG
jgi:hypothetical protein